jgi:hypothetical protein
MTTRTDWRRTCAELIEDVCYLIDCVDHDCCDPVALMECREHLSQTRTALAQPEPEGPTERIASIATAVRECAFGWEPTARLIGNVCAEDVADLCGAILTRYARPTTEPVPVAERPWEREGWRDPDGECWWCPPDGPPYWQMANPAMVYGGWLLPHHALPLPTPTL